MYLNSGWPISGGDPLALLSGRGPYFTHINSNKSRIICREMEPNGRDIDGQGYCDSGDYIVDRDIFINLTLRALDSQKKSCSVLL
jgi:hypothetical protein